VLSVTPIIKQSGVAVMLGIFSWEVPSLNLNWDAVYPDRVFCLSVPSSKYQYISSVSIM